jgi:hypothetical protein
MKQISATPLRGNANAAAPKLTRVRQRSGEVREAFRPFMAKLHEFRARLDRAPVRRPVNRLARNWTR